jgi:uncharacterized membrane protein
MVIMALEHVRDYFHFGAFVYDPMDLDTTTPGLFMTRFITHFCAPVFIFLTGTSASLFGQNKSKKELSAFLFTRGLWLFPLGGLFRLDSHVALLYPFSKKYRTYKLKNKDKLWLSYL